MKKLLFLAATLLLVISCKVTDPNEPDDSNTFGKKSGVCGDNLTWTLIDGVLTISGTGDMYDYYADTIFHETFYTPWASDEDINTTIKEIKVQNGITSIGNYAFMNCVNLKSITIPNTVTKIGLGAFLNCNKLTSVTIPNGVTSIGWGAFGSCSSLTNITIPNGVTSIGYSAFAYCSSLTTIIVEEGNTVYDSRNNCNAIIETATNTLMEGCMNTIIPNNVTSIGDGAFEGCSGLTSVIIPNSVTSIGDDAFSDCSGLTSVTIGNSVTSIGNYAFYYCDSLTSVTIPNSVTSIGDEAFRACSSLPVIDNLRYADTYLVEVVDKNLSTYNIKSGTRWIGGWAFSDCSSLTSITIPNSVTSIGNWAFRECGSLINLTIPNSVTSIGYLAFSGCSSLTSVTIGNSVTSIGNLAFSGCSNLSSIYNYASVPQDVNYLTFEDVNTNTCVLYVPKESVELYKEAEVWQDFRQIVGIDVPED